jgi:hypothetical protein
MKIIRSVFLVSILFFASAAAQGAETKEPAVWASADRQSIFIGDRIRYQVEASADEGIEISFPKFADDKIGDFEIKDSGLKVKKTIFRKKITINWYDITVYSPGKYTIPRIDIKYKPKAAKAWTTVKTNSIDIAVGSLIPPSGVKDIRDIKGPFRIFEINWLIVAIVLFALIMGAAVFIIYKKRRSAAPLRLPHETALEELEAAKAEYARGGDVKEYYAGISDCVRRYIERVFKLKAPEMTTEEFLNSLKESGGLSLNQKELLKDFLNACDLVKFAKYAPARGEIEAVLVTAQKFIEETKDVHI